MGLSELVGLTDAYAERASTLQAYEIVDHTFADLLAWHRGQRPTRTELPVASYYLAGVNSKQREVYDGHCAERYAERSPHHYSSREDVAGRAALKAARQCRNTAVFVAARPLTPGPPQKKERS